MKKKVFSILLLIVILASSAVMLAGCKKTTKREITENIEETVANIKADVIIEKDEDGGELIAYTRYYVNYKESKMYVYKYSQIVPLTYEGDETLNDPKADLIEQSLVEYTLSKDDMKELKEFIESENSRIKGHAEYKITIGDEHYDIKEHKKFKELIEKITNV